MGELVVLLVLLVVALTLLIDAALKGEALVDAGRAERETCCEVTALADAFAVIVYFEKSDMSSIDPIELCN